MSYSYPEIKQLKGLRLQRNSFTTPDGALEVAENVVIARDNIYTSRRGFHQYFDPSSGNLNNLFNFQSKLISIYESKAAYYDDSGIEPNVTGSENIISGEVISVTNNRISRDLKANSNIYFTTDDGVIKLPEIGSDTSKTGAPQGLDVGVSYAVDDSAAFFTDLESEQIVGYRVLFGYRDENDNLIIGAPSQITTIQNIVVENATAASSGAGPYTMTITSSGHGLYTGLYMNFFGSVGGVAANCEGVFQITVVDADTFTYSTTNDPAAVSAIDYSFAGGTQLEITIPSEIDSTSLGWFYQVYRSSQQSANVGIFSDFKLVSEHELTSAEITLGIAYFTDNIPEILLGAELYTNENSREGELQANFRPPLCEDVTFFKGHAIYANTTSRQLIDLSVIDTTVVSGGDYVEIRVTNDIRFVAQTGVGNRTVYAMCADDGGGNLQIDYIAHGFANGDSVFIANIQGGSLAEGTYFVINQSANAFEISLTKGGANVAYNSETDCQIQGITASSGDYSMFYLSESSSASVRLRDTAENLCRAINRNASSEIYAQYVSGISDIPGQMRLQSKSFTSPIYIRANSSSVGLGFSPALPSTFSTVFSTNESQPHVYYASKESEPEAVPLVNFFPVGSKNAAILRCAALRDSLILIKQDGVWRVTGDGPDNFTATLLDGTVICVASNSADIINNQVAFLSNQGVCFVTESSVQIFSREGIEDPLQPILGQANLANVTSGQAYESERLYLLTTSLPNNTDASTTYVFNILTQEWSTWDKLFSGSVVGPGDKLYLISLDNDIKRERKNQNRTDYSDENYSITINSLDSDTNTMEFTIVGVLPQNGDMLIKDDVITRIDSNPSLISGDDYSCQITAVNNLEASDVVDLYARFSRKMKLVPFHAGLVGRMKLFAQMSVHLRDNGMSKATVTYTGATYGGSEVVEWVSDLNTAGWGLFPWGFEPWGQETGINLTTGTQPAPIMRLYVPSFQARNTFLQPIIEHIQAGEPTNIQAFSFAVRPYRERVSR
jgi:hypothetical protein